MSKELEILKQLESLVVKNAEVKLAKIVALKAVYQAFAVKNWLHLQNQHNAAEKKAFLKEMRKYRKLANSCVLSKRELAIDFAIKLMQKGNGVSLKQGGHIPIKNGSIPDNGTMVYGGEIVVNKNDAADSLAYLLHNLNR